MLESSNGVRIDKWLWAARFFKTRGLAADAVDGGKVEIHGHKPKPAKLVRVGDQVRIRIGPFEHLVTIRGLSERRGPAAEAVKLYEEDPAAKVRRETLAEQHRIAAQAFSYGEGKPSKKERRAIEKVQGEAVNLLVIVGPPAVGKMTVGLELERLTGMRLFHNHMTIDLVLPFFAFGTSPFGRLVKGFRHAIFEEVAASDLPGLIFTYAWAFGHPLEQPAVEGYCAPFASRAANIGFLELCASQEERLRRNSTELRLAHKPSKRHIEGSTENLLTMDREHRLNSDGDFPWPDKHLKIDNTNVSPADVARRAIAHFRLPQATG